MHGKDIDNCEDTHDHDKLLAPIDLTIYMRQVLGQMSRLS